MIRAWNRQIGSKGFSLVELFVAIIIAGILIALGLPSFLGLLQRSSINAGARQVLYEIRAVQNLAVTRGGVFGFHWGGDPAVGMATSFYRIERDPSGTCAAPPAGWPAPADTTATVYPDVPVSIQRVIRDWFDLAGEYPGVTIQSVRDQAGTAIGGVMFNSRGASVNTCTAVTFPVWVCVLDGTGTNRIIQIQRAGRTMIVDPGTPPVPAPPANVCT
jgi:prepilin-type N-terminal cleavage/methylation domain-containing protein